MIDYDSLPSYESTKFIRDQERHYPSEPFPVAHMEGFLMKNRGKHFDDVFSEFSHAKWVPHQYRTLDQFRYYVKTDTLKGKDGQIYYRSSWYPIPIAIDATNYVNLFYIHPVTKTLQLRQREASRKKIKIKWKEELKDKFRLIGPGEQYIKIKGIWYHLTFEVDTVVRHFYNGVWKTRVRSLKEMTKLLNSMYDPARYRKNWFDVSLYNKVKFKQLNSKELKKNDLKND